MNYQWYFFNGSILFGASLVFSVCVTGVYSWVFLSLAVCAGAFMCWVYRDMCASMKATEEAVAQMYRQRNQQPEDGP